MASNKENKLADKGGDNLGEGTISKIDSVSLQDVRNFGVEMFHNSSPAMALYGKVKDALDVNQFSQKLLN